MSNCMLKTSLTTVLTLACMANVFSAEPVDLRPVLPSVTPAPKVRVQSQPRAVSIAPRFLRKTYARSNRAASVSPPRGRRIRPSRVRLSATAEFTLVNNTSGWLSLFVDGRRTVSVPPGDRGTTLIRPGTHTFRAVTPDGRSVQRRGYVKSSGQKWTVSEK